MSSRLRVIALAWLIVAVLLRVYASQGGDASIVGGLLFLVWTAPFGMVWQFLLYDHALAWLPVQVAQLLGDVIVVVTAFYFWFIFIPRVRRGQPRGRSRHGSL